MAVWYCIPSARPPAEAEACLSKWRERGYKIALFLDKWPAETGGSPESNFCIVSAEYPGYAQAVNALVAEVLKADPSCDWVVTGGDDVFPDPNHTADEIAAQCSDYFRGFYDDVRMPRGAAPVGVPWPDTFGVMQPTGDRFSGGSIDRICGSPWIGREFARRVNGGKGPLWPEYTHMFADEELQEVATKLGVLWQRPDLTHYHKHFQRVEGTDIATPLAPPPHLVEANSPAHWAKYQALFRARKAAGFPGHEVIA